MTLKVRYLKEYDMKWEASRVFKVGVIQPIYPVWKQYDIEHSELSEA